MMSGNNWGLLLGFLVFAPITYFFFSQAFRYRVRRDTPLSAQEIVKVALWRTLLGIGFVGGLSALLYWLLGEIGTGRPMFLFWGLLYSARLLTWWFVGAWVASIRGVSLVGWVVAGLYIDFGLDRATFAAHQGNLPAIIMAAVDITFLIAILEFSGQRTSLVAKFKGNVLWIKGRPYCATCRYDLTGSTSTVCPECGKAIALAS